MFDEDLFVASYMFHYIINHGSQVRNIQASKKTEKLIIKVKTVY